MRNQKGQALVMVILIGLIALIAVVSATTLVISELRKNIITIFGVSQYQVTYGAMEAALMRLLRDPSYSGETVTLDGSTCYITVTGDITTKNVESRCTNGTYVRKTAATATFAGGIMTVGQITEQP